ncbi:hypothetical protein [Rheinheimera pacifica]|uniref:hypothetical protein n=1 Tax=Rheinheimera pacifica TaxID=173990 RepID=UPI002EDAE303
MIKYLAVVVLIFPVTSFALNIATIEVLCESGQALLLYRQQKALAATSTRCAAFRAKFGRYALPKNKV